MGIIQNGNSKIRHFQKYPEDPGKEVAFSKNRHFEKYPEDPGKEVAFSKNRHFEKYPEDRGNAVALYCPCLMCIARENQTYLNIGN